jgi:hypothetical protein
MAASDNSFTTRVWAPCTPKVFELSDTSEKFMRGVQADTRFTVPGVLWFSSNGLTTSTYYGSVWLTLTIELYDILPVANNQFYAHMLMSSRIKGSLDECHALGRKLLSLTSEQEEKERSKEPPVKDTDKWWVL